MAVSQVKWIPVRVLHFRPKYRISIARKGLDADQVLWVGSDNFGYIKKAGLPRLSVELTDGV
jgi:hypothetical protein